MKAPPVSINVRDYALIVTGEVCPTPRQIVQLIEGEKTFEELFGSAPIRAAESTYGFDSKVVGAIAKATGFNRKTISQWRLRNWEETGEQYILDFAPPKRQRELVERTLALSLYYGVTASVRRFAA